MGIEEIDSQYAKIDDNLGWRGESYLPFSPNQIKSATGNSGEFSASPNILFQEEGKTLAVLHNVSSERLIDIEALGGCLHPLLL